MAAENESFTLDDVTANLHNINNHTIPAPAELSSMLENLVDLAIARVAEGKLHDLVDESAKQTVAVLIQIVVNLKDDDLSEETQEICRILQTLGTTITKSVKERPNRDQDIYQIEKKFIQSLESVASLDARYGSGFTDFIRAWLNGWTQLIHAWMMQVLVTFDGQSIDTSLISVDFPAMILAESLARRLLLGSPAKRSETLQRLISKKDN